MSLASISDGSHIAATLLPGGAMNLNVTSIPQRYSLQNSGINMMKPSLAQHHGFIAEPIASAASFGLSNRRNKTARVRAHRYTASDSSALVAEKKALIRNVRSIVAQSHSAKINRPVFGGAALQLVARSFAAVGLIMQRSTLDDDSLAYLRYLGIAVYLAASIPDMLSFMLAPSKFLMLLSSIEPILVAVLTSLLLPQESALFTSQQWVASIICVAGIFGCTLFSTGFSLEALVDEAPVTLRNGSEGLFLVSAWRNLLVYLTIALPCLMYFAWKARQCYKEMESTGMARFPLSFPITVALSSALQHSALVMLGLTLSATGSMRRSPISPIILCIVATVCMLCCSFHVCQGVTQAPPHIFVTLSYTMGALLQMFQSVVIFREYGDDPTKKAFFAVACAFVSCFGLVHLHYSQGKVKKIRFAGGFFGRRDSGADASDLGSIEPRPFSEETSEVQGKLSGSLPAWVLGWRFLRRA